MVLTSTYHYIYSESNFKFVGCKWEPLPLRHQFLIIMNLERNRLVYGLGFHVCTIQYKLVACRAMNVQYLKLAMLLIIAFNGISKLLYILLGSEARNITGDILNMVVNRSINRVTKCTRYRGELCIQPLYLYLARHWQCDWWYK